MQLFSGEQIFLRSYVLFLVSFPKEGALDEQGEGMWQQQETAEKGTLQVTGTSVIIERA